MWMTVLQVALGGAIGAAARFMAGIWIARLWGQGFPLAILSVNVLGSFLMGLFVIFAARNNVPGLQPFVMAGLLGGFTTFSAFSLEAVTLVERGQTAAAILYVTLSVVLSILGLVLGLWIARTIWP